MGLGGKLRLGAKLSGHLLSAPKLAKQCLQVIVPPGLSSSEDNLGPGLWGCLLPSNTEQVSVLYQLHFSLLLAAWALASSPLTKHWSCRGNGKGRRGCRGTSWEWQQEKVAQESV